MATKPAKKTAATAKTAAAKKPLRYAGRESDRRGDKPRRP